MRVRLVYKRPDGTFEWEVQENVRTMFVDDDSFSVLGSQEATRYSLPEKARDEAEAHRVGQRTLAYVEVYEEPTAA